MGDVLDIAVGGDVVLDEPDAAYWLAGIALRLREADLAIVHLEVAHTDSQHEMEGDIPAPGAPPENLVALAKAGVAMVSLAGNHIADSGAQGIVDTLAGLDANAISHAGAGENLEQARKPAVAMVGERRIALLSYNCVGPEQSWADAEKAGCAYLPIAPADGSPINPRAELVDVLPRARDILHEDVSAARRDADLVIVALHKGIVHTPVRLAAYERQISQAAIDAGADAVIGHHAHIVRGIEFHRGKPIFHGLGNCCVVTSALSPGQDHPARAEWAERRKIMFGFEPDPAYTLAPFHPEAVNAFIGRLLVDGEGRIEAGITPVHVEAPGRPVLAKGERADEIARYLESITVAAGLPPIIIDDGFRVRPAA